MALSAVLLTGAALFLRTLSNLQAVDLGFSRDRLLIWTSILKRRAIEAPLTPRCAGGSSLAAQPRERDRVAANVKTAHAREENRPKLLLQARGVR